MYTNLGRNIPEQILNYVVSSENFKFVHQLTNEDYQTWIVYQKSNGRSCIAKKFLMSKPNNTELHKYYQEVVTLSQIDNFFVSSLIGFTNKYPYCIFMEYSKNSVLYNALHIDKKLYPLTGAHLTNIAMGIAYGMIKIQQMKMTEPYLSSSNIFLTSELLPKICHFKTIPDPVKWKAPELYHSVTRVKYDTGLLEDDSSDSQNDFYKVDVFAYGLILHELLTRKDYFLSMSPERVKNIIYNENKRPPIPQNTPQTLKNLIKSCWSQHPGKRPSFSQIFEYFESGEVSFPNTSSGTIDALLKRIKKHEANLVNSIKMDTYRQEIAYTSPISTRSLSPHSRRSSPFTNNYEQQAMTPNQHHHNHHRRHRSVSRNDFNFFNDDLPQRQPLFLSDAPTKRRGNSVSHERNRFVDTSINHNNNSMAEDNEIYFSTDHSSDNSFTNANTTTSLTSQSTTSHKHRNSNNQNNNLLKMEKRSVSQTQSKPLRVNLDDFKDCNKLQFMISLESLDKKIDPSQYRQFFKIISKYFSANYPKDKVLAIFNTIQKLFNKNEAMDEFIRQGLYKLLPLDDQQLIGSTFDILYLLFVYSPQSFQNDFTQQMSLLITKNPAKALTLISIFAKSFSEMSDPWSLLELLFKHSDIFFRSNVGVEYISCLFFLNFNFSKFSEEKKGKTRPILVRFLTSSDKAFAIIAYRAIINLYDDFFKIPIDILVEDLNNPDIYLFAISLMLRMKDSDLIPIASNKSSKFNLNNIVCPLIKYAEKHKEASILLLRYLKNKDAAKIVLRESICLTIDLPEFTDTLKIFISLMNHLSLRESIADLEILPEFLTNLIKSGKITCMRTLQSIIKRLNLKKKIFGNLIEHKFFSLLLNSFKSYNDDGVTVSNLETMTYFAQKGETSEYSKFSNCLKTYIWSENPNVSMASFKCMYVMSFYQKCASRFKQIKLDEDVLKKFGSKDDNAKIKEFLENLERAEISD